MGGLSFRRGAVFIVIVGSHALLIYLLLHLSPAADRGSAFAHRPAITWIEVNVPDIVEDVLPPPSEPRTRRPLPDRSSSFQAPTVAGEPVHETSTDKLPIDWYDEARQLGKDAVADALKFERRDCDPHDPPTTLLPKCRKLLPEYDWDNPKEKRAGFVGPLPYVRLGKKCVVGLGFFGCGFGKPPPESNELYERMKDPNRPTSSVPDVDAINKMPLGKPQKKN